ncbi:MAG TPA: GNAT family N-acetyltransferase [Thermomicrobiales bacterium]|jgi:GNAT superfamily N-acetyltransferase
MSSQLQTRVTIRPATAADYPTLARLQNAVFSEYATTADTIRFGDEHRDPKCQLGRFIAEHDGEPIGFGEYTQSAGMYHPRKFGLGITVLPAWQGQGIGTALYDHTLRALEPFAPLSVRGQIRADWARSLRFLARRGFTEAMRSWESRLAVADFDPTPFAEAEARTAASGIIVRTYAELAHDPERDRKLYELDRELSEDVPHPEPHTPVSYEFFIERILTDPDLLPDAYFVALDAATGTYAGMSQLWHSQGSDDLYTGLTGVRRAFRRRGIALALKLRGIAYAKAQGRPTIKTWNESNNRAMLAINEALGFVKQPAWIDFVKTLRDDDGAQH